MKQYVEGDEKLSLAPLYWGVYTIGFTYGWYHFAKRIRIFNKSNTLKATIPVALIFASIYTKGLAYHTAGINQSLLENEQTRKRKLERHEREARMRNFA